MEKKFVSDGDVEECFEKIVELLNGIECEKGYLESSLYRVWKGEDGKWIYGWFDYF